MPKVFSVSLLPAATSQSASLTAPLERGALGIRAQSKASPFKGRWLGAAESERFRRQLRIRRRLSRFAAACRDLSVSFADSSP